MSRNSNVLKLKCLEAKLAKALIIQKPMCPNKKSTCPEIFSRCGLIYHARPSHVPQAFIHQSEQDMPWDTARSISKNEEGDLISLVLTPPGIALL